MPKRVPQYDHLLSNNEYAGILGFHTRLTGEDSRWLNGEIARLQDATGYRLNLRNSVGSALRLYLIADRGYSVAGCAC